MYKIIFGLILGLLVLTGCTEITFLDKDSVLETNETQLTERKNSRINIECESFKSADFTNQGLAWSALPLCAIVESDPFKFERSLNEYRVCFEFEKFSVGSCT